MDLVEERLSWIPLFENGYVPPFTERMSKEVVERYENNYTNPYWRASVVSEKACAYLLWERGDVVLTQAI